MHSHTMETYRVHQIFKTSCHIISESHVEESHLHVYVQVHVGVNACCNIKEKAATNSLGFNSSTTDDRMIQALIDITLNL